MANFDDEIAGEYLEKLDKGDDEFLLSINEVSIKSAVKRVLKN